MINTTLNNKRIYKYTDCNYSCKHESSNYYVRKLTVSSCSLRLIKVDKPRKMTTIASQNTLSYKMYTAIIVAVHINIKLIYNDMC